MSPALSKTSRDEIILTARKLIEEIGVDNLSMKLIAERVHIQAPSLYKHFGSKDILIRAVVEFTLTELATVLKKRIKKTDPISDIKTIIYAYRKFAHANPNVYKICFASPDSSISPRLEHLTIAIEPLLSAIAQRVEEEHVLDAARMIVSFMHGFVSIELAGAFRLDENVDRAFKFGVEKLVAGL